MSFGVLPLPSLTPITQASGIDLFPTVFTIALAAIACGLGITISQTYRIHNYVGCAYFTKLRKEPPLQILTLCPPPLCPQGS